ncbi:MAG: arsenate reductase ArsC [Acidobacteriota bacterium]
MTDSSRLPAVVFLCTENANRSQMAEGFARALAADRLEVYSAGSAASGEINPRAVEAMAERGIDIAAQRSIATDALPSRAFDVVVTMGCGDACPWLPAARRQDWGLDDPKHLDDAGYRQVRDEIERRVAALVTELVGG